MNQSACDGLWEEAGVPGENIWRTSKQNLEAACEAAGNVLWRDAFCSVTVQNRNKHFCFFDVASFKPVCLKSTEAFGTVIENRYIRLYTGPVHNGPTGPQLGRFKWMFPVSVEIHGYPSQAPKPWQEPIWYQCVIFSRCSPLLQDVYCPVPTFHEGKSVTGVLKRTELTLDETINSDLSFYISGWIHFF